MQYWRMTEGWCVTPGAEGYPAYGVAVTLPDGGVWEWVDVDTDPAAVEELVSRLQSTQPEACHFRDMVLDFIEEMAGKV